MSDRARHMERLRQLAVSHPDHETDPFCLACQWAIEELDRMQTAVTTAQTAACNAIQESQRLQAIVDGVEAASRGDYVVEYGWNSDENRMGYWWGTRGSFVSDRLTWAGPARQDAWLAVGKKAAEKARTP